MATATPTADGHAVNKKYVDDALTEEWVDICDLTTTEDSVIDITADASGNPFSLKKMNVLVWKPVVEGDTTPSMVWTHALTGSTAAYKPLTSSPTAMAGNQATFHAVCAEIKRFWFAESRCGNGVNANANVFMVNSGWLPYGVRPEMKNRDPITGIRLTWGYSGTLPAGTRVEIWGVRA